MASSIYTIETGQVTWAQADMVAGTYYKDVSFCGKFVTKPIVALTTISHGGSGGPDYDVNVFVTNLSTTSMRINISGFFLGDVHYKAIQYD